MTTRAIALLTAAALLLWLLASGVPSRGVEVPVAVPGVEGAKGAERVEPPSEVADAPTRQAAAPTPAADPIVVTGRCVAAETGAPLADVQVALQSEPKIAQVTGRDGRFRLELAAPLPATAVRAEARGRVPIPFELHARRSIDFGDVLLPIAVWLRPRVVDQRGTPVAGVALSFRPGPALSWLPLEWIRTSDARGLVPLEQPRCAGRWQVSVHSELYELAGPHEVDIPPSASGVHEVDIVVKDPDPQLAIRGRLVANDGAPLEGVILHATQERGNGLRGTKTRAAGAFLFARLAPGDGSVSIRLAPTETAHEMQVRNCLELGSTDVELVAHRLPEVALQLQVVDGTTGEPVESYGCRVFRDPWTNNRTWNQDWPAEPAKLQAGGRLRVGGLRKGLHRVSVWPSNTRLAPRTFVPLPIGEGGATLRLELFPTAALRVRVRTPSGQPIAGSRIELGQLLGRAEYLGVTSPTMARDQLEPGQYYGPMVVVLQEALTDAEGKASFRVAPHQDLLALVARGPGHVPTMLGGVRVAPTGGEVEMIVEAGATIRGRVEPIELRTAWEPTPALREMAAAQRDAAAALQRCLPAILLQPPGKLIIVGTADAAWASAQRWPIDEVGRFEIHNVPEGSWDLLVSLPVGHSRRTTVEHIASGEVREILVDVSDLVPGEVDGVAFAGGAPLAHGAIRFWAPALDTEIRADAAGRFHARLAAGRYWPAAWLPSDEGSWAAFAEPIDVRPRQTTASRIDFRARTIDLRVRAAGGDESVGGLAVSVHALDLPFVDTYLRTTHKGITNADGQLRLRSVPPGTIEVRARSVTGPEKPIVLGTLRAPAADTASFELRLPAEWPR